MAIGNVRLMLNKLSYTHYIYLKYYRYFSVKYTLECENTALYITIGVNTTFML